MSERSYIRQQPLWLQLLKMRREREAYQAAARAAYGQMQARNDFNQQAVGAGYSAGHGVTQ